MRHALHRPPLVLHIVRIASYVASVHMPRLCNLVHLSLYHRHESSGRDSPIRRKHVETKPKYTHNESHEGCLSIVPDV